MRAQEYLKGRERKYSQEWDDDRDREMRKTLSKASELLSAFGEDRQIVSGWQPIPMAKQFGWELDPKLIHCQAITFEDHDKRLGHWCIENIERMIEIGLWMKSLLATHTLDVPQVYLQTVAPKCGSRIFQ